MNYDQQQQLQLFKRHVSTLKRSHYIFMFIHALLSCVFGIGVAIWVYYKSIFQMGLLVFFHILTGAYIGAYIAANTILRMSINRVPQTPPKQTILGGKQYTVEEIRVLQEYEVYSSMAPTFITLAIIGMIFIAIYLYNLIYILAIICPQHHHPHSSTPPHHHDIKGATLKTEQGDLISDVRIILSYNRLVKGDFYAKRNVISLKYNETSHEVIFKEKDSNPNQFENWLESNEWISFLNDDDGRVNSAGGEGGLGVVIVKDVGGGGGEDKEQKKNSEFRRPICYNYTAKTYHVIENEINRYLLDSIEKRQNQKTFRIRDHRPNPHMNNEEEDDIEMDLFAKALCRKEYGFMIAITTLLLITEVIELSLIIYNIWLRCVFTMNRFAY